MEKYIQPYPLVMRIIHTGLALFGVAAFLTGELAEEVEHGFSAGYWLHAYLGLTLAVFLFSHFVYRIVAGGWSISKWLPGKDSVYTAIQEDINQLTRFRLPVRNDHSGIAGLVQAFGLLIFLWMSITGIILLYLGGPEGSDVAHAIGEAHEAGEYLIPIFLILHIGAVILHTFTGHAIWQRINPFTK